MDNYENMNSVDRSRATQLFFTISVVAAQIVGLTCIVITGVWMAHFYEGFAWQSKPDREFNYHPLFMVIGMIFLYGDAILVYRVFRHDNKKAIKIVHACLHIFALGFTTIGLKAVFDSHNLHEPKKLPNMYSLHSWLGITTVVLFGLQWVFGLVTFLVPGLNVALRTVYKPVHVFWGMAIFILAIATALMGITEKNVFTGDYGSKSEQYILSNTLGLLLVLLGFIVIFIVTNSNYKREPRPEEEQLILDE